MVDKTPAQILAEIAANLADNTSEDITAAELRSVLIALANSQLSTQAATWATKPASPDLYDTCIMTDMGSAVFIWNGTRWKPLSKILNLASTTQPKTAVTGGTTRVVSDTVTAPAGLLYADCRLEILSRWKSSGSAGNRTARVELDTTVYSGVVMSSTQVSLQMFTAIDIVSDTSQEGFPSAPSPSLGATSSSEVTSAFNVATTDVPINFCVVNSNAGDSLQLRSYSVKVIFP